MIFELSIIFLAVIFLLILYKFDKNVVRKFALTFVGVTLFEYFTQALWLNRGLEPWAYLYLDVSWIIGLGWTIIIIVSRGLVNLYFPDFIERTKFFLKLGLISVAGFLAEWVVLALDIRTYSATVLSKMSGIFIGPVPIEALYYIPVFMTLILTFSLYWEKLLFKDVELKKEVPKIVPKIKRKKKK